MTARRFAGFFLFAAAFLLPLDGLHADPPKVLLLRTQKVGDTTYFHVRLQKPADLAETEPVNADMPFLARSMPSTDPLQMVRLIPQDGGAWAVYERVDMAAINRRQFGGDPFAAPFDEKKPIEKKDFEDKKLDDKKEPDNQDGDEIKGGERQKLFAKIFKRGPKKDNAEDGIDFVGKVDGKKKVAFLLIYPKESPAKAKPDSGDDKKKMPSLMELLEHKQAWTEVAVEIDFSRAKAVAPPKGVREANREPENNDLQGTWAQAQASFFALMEAETPEFSFYGQARESTGRVYHVPAPGAPWRPGGDVFRGGKGGPGRDTARLYEITTGAAAITESLALDRMRSGVVRDKPQDRTVPIAQLKGVDIAEHPWEKMMADKKPADEPLAHLVPFDNYYIHFKSIAKFLEAGDLLDQWGTTLVRAFEVHSKDYRLKQRLERQLCLKSTGLARVFGPAVVKGVAVTGNDPYIREGSDLTILFHLANPAVFKAAVNPFIEEARKKFGNKLKEEKTEYEKVTIESYVSPLREVSLYRAFLGDVAIYSNSPAGIRRVIASSTGKLTPLAESLDFQYMRTVFRADDKAGDGFVFLSDPFIRNLVGPALRIKERRRLEALTSLQMVTNGAMFTAWETGKLPGSHDQLLKATGLKLEELFTPDGGGAFWDAESKVAVSGIYNTQNFATPLIELPIDFVSPAEAQEYEQFRLQYLGLWRRYFDPIGMRLALGKDEVRWETYILPLVRDTQYNELRPSPAARASSSTHPSSATRR